MSGKLKNRCTLVKWLELSPLSKEAARTASQQFLWSLHVLPALPPSRNRVAGKNEWMEDFNKFSLENFSVVCIIQL